MPKRKRSRADLGLPPAYRARTLAPTRLDFGMPVYGRTRSGKSRKGKLRYRRRGKPVRRVIRKSRVRSRNVSISRKKLLNILTVPNFYNAQEAWQLQVPATTNAGKGVQYGCVAYSIPTVPHIQAIATLINPSPSHTNMKVYFTNMFLRYEYSNMSLASCYLTAYFCRSRRDVPDTLNYYNPIVIMQDGWADRGFDSTGRGVLGDDELNLDPYKSFKFCHYFKIYKVKKLKLQGGESGKLAVKCRSRILNMSDLFTKSGADQATWANYSRLFAHVKGSKFILFRAEGEVTNLENTKTAVTATAPRVNFITSFNYTYKRISESISDLNVGPATGFTAGSVEIITEQGQQDVVP